MAAAKNKVHRVSTLAVNDLHRRTGGVGLPAVPPSHQRDNGRQQIETLVGEPIFVAFPLAGFSVRHALHHTGFDQGVQPFAEQVAGAPDVGLELLEAPSTV